MSHSIKIESNYITQFFLDSTAFWSNLCTYLVQIFSLAVVPSFPTACNTILSLVNSKFTLQKVVAILRKKDKDLTVAFRPPRFITQ